MTNYEVAERVERQVKKLSPESLAEYVAEYPGLRDDYDDVIDASKRMNSVVLEFDGNAEGEAFSKWNEKQKAAHNNLISKVVEFLDDLEKFDGEEARALKTIYNEAVDKRVYFTQLALKFLNHE